MAVEIEGLQFEIEAKSEGAAKGIDALVSSFTKLKSALKGASNLDKMAKSLEKISKSMELPQLEQLEKLTASLNGLGSVKISSTVPKRLTEISAALGGITPDVISQAESLSNALQGMSNLNIPAVPKISGRTSSKSKPAKTGSEEVLTSSTVVKQATEEITQYANKVREAAGATVEWGSVLSNVKGQYQAAFGGVGDTLSQAVKTVKEFPSAAETAFVKAGESAKQFKEQIGTVMLSISAAGAQGMLTLPLNGFLGSIQLAAKGFSSFSKAVDSGCKNLKTGFMTGRDAAESFRKTLAQLPTNVLRGLLSLPLNAFSNSLHMGAAAVQRMTGALQQLAGNILAKIKNGFIGIVQQISKATQAAVGIGTVTKQISSMGKALKSVSGKLKQFAASIGRIAMYRAVRAVLSALTTGLKEGIENLYQYSQAFSGTFAASLDKCATSFQYLKNSMAAMVSPLINTLAPAIDLIIDKIVLLLNAVNQLFAKLSGAATFTAAKKAAASYGEAASDASKSTKELKNALMGIDELNIISPNDNSRSGAGGADYSSMFEELPIDSKFDDIAEKLKELFKPIQDSWNDYGEGVMTAFHTAVESIKTLLSDMGNTWAQVWVNGGGYELCSNLLQLLTTILSIIGDIAAAFDEAWKTDGLDFVQSFFDAFNSILSLLISIGETFREAFNDGTGTEIAQLLLQIFTNVNNIIGQIADTFRKVWENGSGLTLCQNILNTIKEILSWIKSITDAWSKAWDNKGEALIQAIFDMLNSVLSLINTISESFRKAFDSGAGQEMLEHILQIVTDLATIVGNLAQRFKEAWDNAGTGDAIAQAILDIFNIILGTIEKITTSTAEWSATLDFSPLLISIKDVLEQIQPLIQNIGDALAWVWENVILPLTSWAIESVLPPAIEAVAAAFTILNAALEVLKPLGLWLWDSFLEPIAQWTGGVIVGTLELISGLLQKLADVLSRLTDVVKGNTSFSDFIQSLTPGEAVLLGLTAAITGITAAILLWNAAVAAYKIVTAAASAVTTAFGTAIGFLTSPIGLVAAAITLLVTAFVLLYQHCEPFRGFVNTIIELAGNLIPGIIKGIGDAVGGLLDFLGGIWDGIVQGFKDFFGIHSPSTLFAEQAGFLILGLLEGLTGNWGSIVDFFGEKLVGIKDTISSAWDDVKTAASEKWGNIKDFLGTTWDNLKTTAGTTFDNVKEGISTTWENVKTTSSSTWDNIKTALGDTWDNIKTAASSTYENIRDKISGVWGETKEKTSKSWDEMKLSLGESWENIRGTADTKFGEVQKKITAAWEDVSKETNTKWNGVKKDLAGIWGSTRDDANQKFTETKEKVISAWTKTTSESVQKWDNIQKTLSAAWSDVKTTAERKFGEVKTSIGSVWSNIISSAKTWGSDICKSLASGISGAISTVTNAVSGVANTVRSFLHFSEPDIGPLSDFHTYMPDMIQLMVKGIRENAYLAENAVYDLASDVSTALNTAADDMEVPAIQAEAHTRHMMEYSTQYDSDAKAESFTVSMKEANGEIVTTLYAIANQLADAIETMADRPIEVDLDGKKVTSQVEKRQRERGRSIMAGGVMG